MRDFFYSLIDKKNQLSFERIQSEVGKEILQLKLSHQPKVLSIFQIVYQAGIRSDSIWRKGRDGSW